jgi:Ran GTPase-activating protein (RanGAP) involved in mRNA processing and transport
MHLLESLLYKQATPTVTDVAADDECMSAESARGVAEALMHHTRLSTLSLCGNGLNNSAAAQLAAGLMRNGVLTVLVLSRNHISDIGAQVSGVCATVAACSMCTLMFPYELQW